jgi:hypothetical protein
MFPRKPSQHRSPDIVHCKLCQQLELHLFQKKTPNYRSTVDVDDNLLVQRRRTVRSGVRFRGLRTFRLALRIVTRTRLTRERICSLACEIGSTAAVRLPDVTRRLPHDCSCYVDYQRTSACDIRLLLHRLGG